MFNQFQMYVTTKAEAYIVMSFNYAQRNHSTETSPPQTMERETAFGSTPLNHNMFRNQIY